MSLFNRPQPVSLRRFREWLAEPEVSATIGMIVLSQGMMMVRAALDAYRARIEELENPKAVADPIAIDPGRCQSTCFYEGGEDVASSFEACLLGPGHGGEFHRSDVAEWNTDLTFISPVPAATVTE